MSGQRRRKRGRPPHDDVLTPAEWRVFHAVQHGLRNAAIARRLGVSADAVKYHLSNILGKLDARNRQELKRLFPRPRTGPLRAQGRKRSEGEGEAMQTEIKGIGQVARTVGDLRQAQRWYGEVLGLTHLFSFGDMAFFDCGGTRLYLHRSEAPNPNESVLYFRVDDIAARYAALQAQGVEFLQAPHRIHRHEDGTEEWMAFFKDPEGRPLALMAQVKDQE